jgi:hypothetical protein
MVYDAEVEYDRESLDQPGSIALLSSSRIHHLRVVTGCSYGQLRGDGIHEVQYSVHRIESQYCRSSCISIQAKIHVTPSCQSQRWTMENHAPQIAAAR